MPWALVKAYRGTGRVEWLGINLVSVEKDSISAPAKASKRTVRQGDGAVRPGVHGNWNRHKPVTGIVKMEMALICSSSGLYPLSLGLQSVLPHFVFLLLPRKKYTGQLFGWLKQGLLGLESVLELMQDNTSRSIGKVLNIWAIMCVTLEKLLNLTEFAFINRKAVNIHF